MYNYLGNIYIYICKFVYYIILKKIRIFKEYENSACKCSYIKVQRLNVKKNKEKKRLLAADKKYVLYHILSVKGGIKILRKPYYI